jgi:hypothetical protein
MPVFLKTNPKRRELGAFIDGNPGITDRNENSRSGPNEDSAEDSTGDGSHEDVPELDEEWKRFKSLAKMAGLADVGVEKRKCKRVGPRQSYGFCGLHDVDIVGYVSNWGAFEEFTRLLGFFTGRFGWRHSCLVCSCCCSRLMKCACVTCVQGRLGNHATATKLQRRGKPTFLIAGLLM